MSLPVKIVGATPSGLLVNVEVNEAGELKVAQGDFDLTKFQELGVDDQVYNFYGPRVGKQFVLTGLLAYGDKQIATTNSTVEIFEADAPDSGTVKRIILQFEIGQSQSIPFPNVRILANPGVWINARCDNDDVHLNIVGHYINTVRRLAE
jgi:hypothetical protein